jgi:hypothetical protein
MLFRLASTLFVLLPALASAAVPAYLREAINRFHAEPPAGWAYTVTTTRGNETSSERFDPARPKGGEWTLLQRDGRAPTADELERYVRFKAGNTPATARGTFERGDLDLDGAQLVREDAERAQFQVRFRADADQPLLAHVYLELTVRKAPATVEQCVLRLFETFSPALGVRMHELAVTTTLTAPTDDRPALPREVVSRFRGRMFFLVPIEEDLRIVYSDFVPPPAAR